MMKHSERRIKSYENWSIYNQAKPFELACAGFKYTGE